MFEYLSESTELSEAYNAARTEKEAAKVTVRFYWRKRKEMAAERRQCKEQEDAESYSAPASNQPFRALGRPLFGGEGYVIYQIEQEGICQDATGNPSFLAHFTMMDILVLAGLGHVFLIGVFPQTGWHCKFVLELYLVFRSSASSTSQPCKS
jgi:hypothetical protein